MGSIRALRPEDDRSRFHSGEPRLDRFFRLYAGQNQFRHHASVTYIYEDGGAILGFATVTAGEMSSARLPKGFKKTFPHPLPILRLARLAVDASARGRGLGKELLRFVLHLGMALSCRMGCVGVLVDAKPESANFYKTAGFLPLDVVEGELQTETAPVPLFLPLQKIHAAFREGP